jgi:sulfonate transport system substrate-binding protein
MRVKNLMLAAAIVGNERDGAGRAAQDPPLLHRAGRQLGDHAVPDAGIGEASQSVLHLRGHSFPRHVISDELQDGVPGYFSDEFVVLKDGPIKTVEDLKGKVLGVNAVGSGTDIPLRAMLRKHNLKDKTDLTIVEGPIPALPAMLYDHKIDLFPAVLPFSADPKLQAMTRTLFTQADAMGVTQLGMWAARAPFIAEHRAALVDFMEDALRQERWYFDPANHKEAVEIAAKVTKAPPAAFDSWLFEKKGEDGDYYRDPNGVPAIASIQSGIEEQQKLGLLKERIEVKNYVDLSLVEEAAKRLK